ncbi:MAG: TonB-dependent receptor plug domain-containing protein, partial [Gemmatimonadetes bacterium]|nr:TonB-dependent receptor plug domain-containing protein [Gemmatimonadota bacterium]
MRRSLFAPAGAFLALAMFLTAPLPAIAQDTGTIVGTVTDASSGRPLESVQVFIEGSGLGTLSNSAGRFLIVGAPTGQLTINAELVGYRASSATVTVSAGQSVVADLTMEQTAIALEEIVVTGAGIATEKKRLGNTIATVNVDELQDQPITDFSQLISGREPGLVGLPSSGTTGEGARIRIRGTASLSQSNEPLVYVDGVRIDNSGGFAPTGTNGSQNLAGGQGNPSRLDDIPPDAIERIEILKGAAAATLYGTEASNGVIQIFTKRGRQGPAQWSFQTDQSAISVPTDRMQPLAGFASDQEQLDRMNQRFGTNLQMYDVHQEDFLPGAFTTGYSQIYSGSVRGGSDAITYFVSG